MRYFTRLVEVFGGFAKRAEPIDDQAKRRWAKRIWNWTSLVLLLVILLLDGIPQRLIIQVAFYLHSQYLPATAWDIGKDRQTNPLAIAVDPQGNVYVGGVIDGVIHKFTNDGRPLITWKNGRDSDDNIGPDGIALDHTGHIYTTDYFVGINKYSTSGHFISTWPVRSQQKGTEVIDSFWGIAVSPAGNVYVVANFENCILEYTPDGKFIRQWGSKGSEAGQFNDPRGIAIDSHGIVYVVDSENHRIQRFTDKGVLIGNLVKWSAWHFFEYIAIDASDNVYVADKYFLWKYAPNGTLLTKWPVGNLRTVLFPPFIRGLAVDNAGNVFAVDSDSARVYKYRPRNHK
ncbi:MAG: NHL repeat-containing protein [Armatimonadota bacterium]